jgi:hypothetical protein
MKAIFLAIVTILVFNKSIAGPKPLVDIDTLRHAKYYIVITNERSAFVTKFAYIDLQACFEEKILSDENNLKDILKCDVIWILKLKPGVKLYDIDDIFKVYSINPIYKSLPIVIDDEKIDAPQMILISPNQIEKVEVIKVSNPYIKITLIDYEEIKKENADPNRPKWN